MWPGYADVPLPPPALPAGAVAVGEEQSPSTRQAVDGEVAAMLKAAYRRVTRWAGPWGQLLLCWVLLV